MRSGEQPMVFLRPLIGGLHGPQVEELLDMLSTPSCGGLWPKLLHLPWTRKAEMQPC